MDPFFLQELASFSWNNAQGPQINESDVQASYTETIKSLDDGFFRVRLEASGTRLGKARETTPGRIRISPGTPARCAGRHGGQVSGAGSAPIAIYSTATSSPADAPRGMEFLYSLNRLNVATLLDLEHLGIEGCDDENVVERQRTNVPEAIGPTNTSGGNFPHMVRDGLCLFRRIALVPVMRDGQPPPEANTHGPRSQEAGGRNPGR